MALPTSFTEGLQAAKSALDAQHDVLKMYVDEIKRKLATAEGHLRGINAQISALATLKHELELEEKAGFLSRVEVEEIEFPADVEAVIAKVFSERRSV